MALKRARLPSSAATAWSHGSVAGGRRGFRVRQPSIEEEDPEKSTISEEETVEPEQKPQRVSIRKQRVSVENVDLLTIPGVGPRNLRKLVDKGIGGVADLKQLYRDKVRLFHQ